MSQTKIDDIEKIMWDIIVIGTGIGGGTVGLKLAEAGKRVLFLEKGKSHLDNNKNTLSGKYAEMFFPEIERPEPKHFNILQRSGRWANLIFDASDKKIKSQIPFVGSGTGGSSALYGMVMERFWPIDFEPNVGPSKKKGEISNLWPFSYNELKPFYELAEKLYQVRGTVDSLRNENIVTFLDPPDLIESNQEIYSYLKNKGYHPYQVPLACEFKHGCKNCQGFLCPTNCRNDSAKICLEPAINQYGATLLDLCEVKKLEATNGSIHSIICSHHNNTLRLQSKIIILAAGALQSPAILLRSVSNEYPNGLANSSDQVGRNLMRHYIDIYAISTKQKPLENDYQKQIAFNDLYYSEDGRLGTVQSFGKLPPTEIQVATIHQKLKNSPLPFLANIFELFKPIAAYFAKTVFSKRVILSTIMEDMPYPTNRITISANGDVIMNYKINSIERNRIKIFRKKMKQVFKSYSYILIKQADSNGRIAHVCGTCRIGHSAKDSVLNAMNQSHDIANLYIVDSSFFPTSGGTNPALTIAANALRVSDYILKNLTQNIEAQN